MPRSAHFLVYHQLSAVTVTSKSYCKWSRFSRHLFHMHSCRKMKYQVYRIRVQHTVQYVHKNTEWVTIYSNYTRFVLIISWKLAGSYDDSCLKAFRVSRLHCHILRVFLNKVTQVIIYSMCFVSYTVRLLTRNGVIMENTAKIGKVWEDVDVKAVLEDRKVYWDVVFRFFGKDSLSLLIFHLERPLVCPDWFNWLDVSLSLQAPTWT